MTDRSDAGIVRALPVETLRFAVVQRTARESEVSREPGAEPPRVRMLANLLRWMPPAREEGLSHPGTLVVHGVSLGAEGTIAFPVSVNVPVPGATGANGDVPREETISSTAPVESRPTPTRRDASAGIVAHSDTDGGEPVPFNAVPLTSEDAAAVPMMEDADPIPLSIPMAIQETIEVFFPQLAPLSGAVALDVSVIESGADRLFGALAGLDATQASDWADPERWAWAAAAVLLAGGVAYGVRVRRVPQLADRVTLGTDSVLARRENRDAKRLT